MSKAPGMPGAYPVMRHIHRHVESLYVSGLTVRSLGDGLVNLSDSDQALLHGPNRMVRHLHRVRGFEEVVCGTYAVVDSAEGFSNASVLRPEVRLSPGALPHGR